MRVFKPFGAVAQYLHWVLAIERIASRLVLFWVGFLTLVVICRFVRFFEVGGRGLPGGKSLFFASPKDSKPRKGDPQSGALRATCERVENRVSAELAGGSDNCSPDPGLRPLRRPSQDGAGGLGSGEARFASDA
ncbi:MAG: hypothetical protein JWP47_163, partial [Polaromonas sp.]|nr:hypothetical protein [Polaromonas sp.]